LLAPSDAHCLTDLVVPHRPMEKRAESTQITYTLASAYHFRNARPNIKPALSGRKHGFAPAIVMS
jgi:hypothetical protein